VSQQVRERERVCVCVCVCGCGYGCVRIGAIRDDSTVSLFVRPLKDHHPHFVSSFVLYRGEQVVAVKGCVADDQCSSLFRALLAGLTAAPLFGVSDKSFASSMFNSRKHSCLTASVAFINFINSFLALDELHQAELRSFSVKWSGLSGRKQNLERASSDATRRIAAMPPRSILPPKLKPFDSWRSDYISNHHTHSSAPWISCPPRKTPRPPHSSKGGRPLPESAAHPVGRHPTYHTPRLARRLLRQIPARRRGRHHLPV